MFAALPRWFRFLIVGALNTAVGYALFALFIFAGTAHLSAVVLATACGALFNFYSIGTHVFAQSGWHILPRFLGVYAAQCLINSSALDLLEAAGTPVLLAQALLVPFLATGVYFAMRQFVFVSR